jgi:hypothetical protein
VRGGPCTPAPPLGTQPSAGQSRWSCTRSARLGSVPGRGSSGRRGFACTASRPRLGRAEPAPTKLVPPPGQRSWSAATRRPGPSATSVRLSRRRRSLPGRLTRPPTAAMDASLRLATQRGPSMGDAADDDEDANDWLLRAPVIAVRTIAIAVRTVDRVPLLLVLVRWMSCLQPSHRDVASTYVILGTPTICTGADEFRQDSDPGGIGDQATLVGDLASSPPGVVTSTGMVQLSSRTGHN